LPSSTSSSSSSAGFSLWIEGTSSLLSTLAIDFMTSFASSTPTFLTTSQIILLFLCGYLEITTCVFLRFKAISELSANDNFIGHDLPTPHIPL
jgi:hypothetical protein